MIWRCDNLNLDLNLWAVMTDFCSLSHQRSPFMKTTLRGRAQCFNLALSLFSPFPWAQLSFLCDKARGGGNMTPNSSARPGPDKSSAAWLSSYWLHTSLHCYFKAKLCSMRVRAKKSRHKLVSFTTQLKMLEDRPGRKLSEEVSFCHGWCKELSILCEEQYR